jgi:hypothetical protein
MQSVAGDAQEAAPSLPIVKTLLFHRPVRLHAPTLTRSGGREGGRSSGVLALGQCGAPSLNMVALLEAGRKASV